MNIKAITPTLLSLFPVIKFLKLNAMFNKPLPSLPPYLHTFILGDEYNHILPPLPSTLTSLYVGRSFTQLNPDLPPSLTSLEFSPDNLFNTQLPHLPITLRTLKFGSAFIRPISSQLLLLTTLQYSFSHQLSGAQFPSLTNLVIGKNRAFKLFDIFPPSLTSISGYVSAVPPNVPALKSISLGGMLTGYTPVVASSVTTVQFGQYFNQPISKLPPSLTSLTFGSDFNSTFVLPDTLLHLEFGKSFNNPLKHLPPSLATLIFGDQFSQPLPSLPPSLTTLSCGLVFNHPLPSLPDRLTTLRVGWGFSHRILPLPTSLTELDLGFGFSQLDTSPLPPKLKRLSVVRGPIPPLPESLEFLQLKGDFYCQLELPPSLKTLILLGNCDDVLFFPPTLQNLHLGHKFSQNMGPLPITLKTLIISKNSPLRKIDVDQFPGLEIYRWGGKNDVCYEKKTSWFV